MNDPTKTFPLCTVLSVSSGRLLTKSPTPGYNGIGDLYEILNWLCDDSLLTHQLPRAFHECQPWLLRWFPELNAANTIIETAVHSATTKWDDDFIETLMALCISAGCLEAYEIPRIPRDDHEYKNPYDELVSMRGTDEGIIVVDASAEGDSL